MNALRTDARNHPPCTHTHNHKCAQQPFKVIQNTIRYYQGNEILKSVFRFLIGLMTSVHSPDISDNIALFLHQSWWNVCSIFVLRNTSFSLLPHSEYRMTTNKCTKTIRKRTRHMLAAIKTSAASGTAQLGRP